MHLPESLSKGSKKKHSGLSITSFVLVLVGIPSSFLASRAFDIDRLLMNYYHLKPVDLYMKTPPFIFRVWLILRIPLWLLSIGTFVFAIGFCVAGFIQKDRKHLFSVLGLIGSIIIMQFLGNGLMTVFGY